MAPRARLWADVYPPLSYVFVDMPTAYAVLCIMQNITLMTPLAVPSQRTENIRR